jgi:GT2 family glycosyltransferase
MAVRLSVVIVSFNTEDLLRECLSSILAPAAPAEFEVIVVDNASTDGTRKLLRDEFPAVRTILNDDNRRWAGGNNIGASAAAGDILLFLNSDTVVKPGALEGFIRFFDGRPEAAIAGCRLLNPDGSLQRSCRSLPGVFNLFSEASFLYLAFPGSDLFGRFHMTNFAHDEVREVDMVTGAAIAVRRDDFAAIGPFDEEFHFYGEETDYCFRAKRLGRRVYFFPDSEIVHLGGGSPQHRQRHFENLHEGLRRFLRKHHHGPELAAMIALQWLGEAVRVPVYFLKGLLTGDGALLRKSLYYLKLLF